MKSDIREWLACADFEKIVDASSGSNRTIGTLMALTYSDDPLICRRSIDAIGRCAAKFSKDRPRVYTNYLRRLFWMMSDESGSVAPHAPAVIGEIIGSNSEEFIDFIPLTVSLLNLEPEDKPLFLPWILYALGRIGEANPGAVEEGLKDIEESLRNPDPQVRVMAVQCLNRAGYREVLLRNPELVEDDGKVQIYRNECIIDTTVGAIYKIEIEKKISGPGVDVA